MRTYWTWIGALSSKTSCAGTSGRSVGSPAGDTTAAGSPAGDTADAQPSPIIAAQGLQVVLPSRGLS